MKEILQEPTPLVSTRFGNGWLKLEADKNILAKFVHNGADQLLMVSLPPLLKALANLKAES